MKLSATASPAEQSTTHAPIPFSRLYPTGEELGHLQQASPKAAPRAIAHTQTRSPRLM